MEAWECVRHPKQLSLCLCVCVCTCWCLCILIIRCWLCPLRLTCGDSQWCVFGRVFISVCVCTYVVPCVSRWETHICALQRNTCQRLWLFMTVAVQAGEDTVEHCQLQAHTQTHTKARRTKTAVNFIAIIHIVQTENSHKQTLLKGRTSQLGSKNYGKNTH